MKMAVIYYSRTENTKKMAEAICEGMMKVNNVQAKAFSIDAVDADFVNASDCVVVGTPVYYTDMAGEVEMWLDNEAGKYSFKNKIVGAFATAAYIHGGADIALQNILTALMFRGAMAYSGGSAFGRPPIHLGPVAVGDVESFRDLFVTYGERMAIKTVGNFTTCC